MSDRIRIIDTHAHVLFGLDDGAESIEESVRLIREEIRQGAVGLIATPHYSRRSMNTLQKERVEERIRAVKAALGEKDFVIYAGQETRWHEELPERIRQGYGLTLAGGRYVLVEFDEDVEFRILLDAARKLEWSGLLPVFAHVERYGCLRTDGERRLVELKGQQVWLQMNFDSLEGSMFDKDARWCREMVKKGYIDLLATDAHRMDSRRPEIEKAAEWLKKHLTKEEIERMTFRNPMRILKDGVRQDR